MMSPNNVTIVIIFLKGGRKVCDTRTYKFQMCYIKSMKEKSELLGFG